MVAPRTCRMVLMSVLTGSSSFPVGYLPGAALAVLNWVRPAAFIRETHGLAGLSESFLLRTPFYQKGEREGEEQGDET